MIEYRKIRAGSSTGETNLHTYLPGPAPPLESRVCPVTCAPETFGKNVRKEQVSCGVACGFSGSRRFFYVPETTVTIKKPSIAGRLGALLRSASEPPGD